MRLAMLGLGVLVLAGLAAFLVVRGGSGGGAARTAGAAGGASEGGSAVAGAAMPAAEREALAELQAELEKAAPVDYRSDEERLMDARAWVAANRPADRPFNEMEAQILALMDVLLDGKRRSAEWMMNMSQIEVEMIRAIDINGDGQVSDDEVQYFIDENIAGMFNPMEHPYLQERFDANGDGQTTPDELAALAGLLSEGAMAGAFERGKLEAWDDDDDGFVSAEERVAGEQAADRRLREMFGDMLSQMGGEAVDAWLGDPDKSPEEQAAAREEFLREVAAEAGEQTVQAMEAQREMLLSQAASEAFLNDLRVDNLPQPELKEVMSSMPQPPDVMAFDIDGDGNFAEDERAAQAQAMQDYQKAVERWGSELTAYRLAAQFENAISQSDADADGRMSPDEWEGRIDDLLDERDRRLFLRSYDLDGSGRVDAGELGSYLEWYRDGSLRADVNFDGAIDGRDLEEMAVKFQRQRG